MEIITISMARAEQGRQAKKAGGERNGDKAIWGKERQLVQSTTECRLEECSQAPSCFGSLLSHASFPDSAHTFLYGGLGNAAWSKLMLLLYRTSVSCGDRGLGG